MMVKTLFLTLLIGIVFASESSHDGRICTRKLAVIPHSHKLGTKDCTTFHSITLPLSGAISLYESVIPQFLYCG